MDVFYLQRLFNLHFDSVKIQGLQIKIHYELHKHYLVGVCYHTCLIDINGKSCLVYSLQWIQCCFALDYQSERFHVLKLTNCSNHHTYVFYLVWSSLIIQVGSLDAFCSFSSINVLAFLKEYYLLLVSSGCSLMDQVIQVDFQCLS